MENINMIETEVNEQEKMSLEEFLSLNTVEGLTKEIILSERLENFKFKIGSMTKEDLEKHQKVCILRDKRGNVLKQDTMKFNELIIINHCLYPNFKSQEFLKKMKVNTPSQAISKSLKLGEATKLAEEIMKFNGFDEFEEIRKNAKN